MVDTKFAYESDLWRYRNRAANVPKPATYQDFIDEQFDQITHGLLATDHTFFADISEHQDLLTTAYPYAAVSLRAHNGTRVDYNVVENWAVAKQICQIVFVYVVFKPGQNNVIMTGLKQVFGNTCPQIVVPMIDMESGEEFATPGNHSAEANQLAALLAAWTGSYDKIYAYANSFDYATNWPGIDSRIKKHTAGYGGSDPSPFGWQYYGGLVEYSSPAGYPRTCAPFGSYVDMNVINLSLAAVLSAFKVSNTPKPPQPPDGDDEDMKQYTLLQQNNSIYYGDGMSYRWITGVPTLNGIQSWLSSRGGDSVVHPTAQPLAVYGLPVGNMPNSAKLEAGKTALPVQPGDVVNGFTVLSVNPDGSLVFADVTYGPEI